MLNAKLEFALLFLFSCLNIYYYRAYSSRNNPAAGFATYFDFVRRYMNFLKKIKNMKKNFDGMVLWKYTDNHLKKVYNNQTSWDGVDYQPLMGLLNFKSNPPQKPQKPKSKKKSCLYFNFSTCSKDAHNCCFSHICVVCGGKHQYNSCPDRSGSSINPNQVTVRYLCSP